MYKELVNRLREESEIERWLQPHSANETPKLLDDAADAIESTNKAYQMISEAYEAEVTKQNWISVTEKLPKCEWGAEVGNIEWISCGMVFAGCFGRGGKYRDAYFRTWTDGTEGIDAKGADYRRQIQIPEPPREET